MCNRIASKVQLQCYSADTEPTRDGQFRPVQGVSFGNSFQQEIDQIWAHQSGLNKILLRLRGDKFPHMCRQTTDVIPA